MTGQAIDLCHIDLCHIDLCHIDLCHIDMVTFTAQRLTIISGILLLTIFAVAGWISNGGAIELKDDPKKTPRDER